MSKLQIKFSHDYHKLPKNWQGLQAKLISVTEVNLENLGAAFIDYDTRIRNPKNGMNYYPLPKKGEYFILLFCNGNMIFTTLRRRTPEKEDYYRGNVGQWFELVYEESKEASPHGK